MSIDASVEFSTQEGVVVAAVVGEIDFANAAAISDELFEALDAGGPGLVADLSGVRYLDSAGVRMLFALAARSEVSRQRLGVVAPENAPLRRLLKLTHLDELVLFCSSVEECIAGVQAPA